MPGRSDVDDCRFDVTLLVGGKKLRVRGLREVVSDRVRKLEGGRL